MLHTEDQGNLIPNHSTDYPQTKTPREKRAGISLMAILILTAGLYGLLILRDGLPLPALVLLAVVWIFHLHADHWAIQPTPQDVPILVLLLLLAVNLVISADRSATLIRIYHILLSFSLCFAIIRLVQFRKHLPALIFALVILAIGAGMLGLLAAEWTGGVLGFLSPIYEKLPRLSSFVPGASINKNTMGGALTFFPPLLLSLLWDRSAFRKMISRYPKLNKLPVWLYKFLVVLALGLVVTVILLTQSRGAWLGTAAGLYLFLVWKEKRFLWVIPIGALILFLVLKQTGISGLPELFTWLDRGQDASLQSRLDIWARVISLTRDFPVTGVGLGALNPVYQLFFNPFLFNEPPALLFHAHNTLLSVTIEMGIPALVLYVSLLSAFVAMAWRAWKGARTINRVLIMGLVCGMFAHQVFGLMDAYPLGKNLGITMWIYFAVMNALYVNRANMVRSFPQPQEQDALLPAVAWWLQVLAGSTAWLVLSLLALAVLRVDVLVSLGVAVLAGVLLGVMLVRNPLFSLMPGKMRSISYPL